MKTIPIISVPFNEDGTIDYASYIETLKYLNQKVERAILFGIASEYAKLSDSEKLDLVKLTYLNKGKLEVYYSITDHSLEVAKATVEKYEQYNPDGYMILGPFNYSPTKENLMTHIIKLSNFMKKPVIVQVAPNETGMSFTYEELENIFELTNCSFKIEGPNIYEYIEVFKSKYPHIKVYNGYAGIYLDKMLEVGADAVVPGCSFVEIYIDLIKKYEQDISEFTKEFKSLSCFISDWMQHTEKIIAVEKQILYKRKVINTPYCRMPNYILNESELSIIDNFCQKIEK